MRSFGSVVFVLLSISAKAFTVYNVPPSSAVSSRTQQPLSAVTMDKSMNMDAAKDKTNKADADDKDKTDAKYFAATVDWDWQTLVKEVFATDKRPIVLFDGVCNLCSGGVNFAIDRDEHAKFRFCSLQSKVAQSLLLRAGKSPKDMSSIVLVTEEDAFFSSNAVSRICMGLDTVALQWFGKMGQFTPEVIREFIYQFVSSNRYQFGENDSCRLDFDGTFTSRFISDPMDES
jgi:predicted DCC family thiol-disulfide oxidoreductase YuxK